MARELVFTDVEFHEQRAQRVRRMILASVVLIVAISLTWTGVGVMQGDATLVGVHLAGVAVGLLTLALLRAGRPNLARHAGIALLIGFIATVMALEGIGDHSQVLHLYLICVAVGGYLVFFDAPLRVPSGYAALCFVVFLAAEFDWVRIGSLVPHTPELDAIAHGSTFVGLFLFLLVLTNLFVRDISEAERQLSVANERLETLLENMLPEKVARRLRQEGRTFADAFAECTILFADVVGFTPLSASQPTDQVVRLLDELFTSFDELAEQAGLEKIKTIGDAYMVAGGVPEARPDHAEAIAELALQMRERVRAFGLQLRIGINSGPVIAGVIGKKRFIYDLWGDAVNLASRMESHGMPDAIQVTEATYRRLQDRYDWQYRGTVEIKGRGAMETWLLRGRKP